MRSIRWTNVEHLVEYEATLPEGSDLAPGGTLTLRFHPSQGQGRVFLKTTEIPVPPSMARATTEANRGTTEADEPMVLLAMRPLRPGPARPTLVGVENPIVDLPGWVEPPEPAGRPVRIEVGPEGGPFRTFEVDKSGDSPFVVDTDASAHGPEELELMRLALAPSALLDANAWVAKITNVGARPIKCFARVFYPSRRRVVQTRMPLAHFETLLEGALRWVTPTLAINQGDLVVSLPREAIDALHVEPIRRSAGPLTQLSLTMEPVRFEVIRPSRFLRDAFEAVRGALEQRLTLLEGRRVSISTAFVGEMLDAVLRGFADLPAVAAELVPLVSRSMAEAAFDAVDAPKTLWGLLGLGAPDDVLAFRASIEVTEIVVGGQVWRLSGEASLESLSATLDVMIPARLFFAPHPLAAQPDHPRHARHKAEHITSTSLALVTRFEATVNDPRFDELSLGGGILEALTPVLEAMANILVAPSVRRQAKAALDSAVREFIAQHRGVLAELLHDAMLQLAERDHRLHDLRRDPASLIIEHFDAIGDPPPERPQRQPRPLGDPIDGPMPADADARLSLIDHIVVVCMENRSFDHMLGYLSHPEHHSPHGRRTDIDGLTGAEDVPMGGKVSGTARPMPGPQVEFRPDPDHSFAGVARQVGERGDMDGFIASFRQRLRDAPEIDKNGLLNDERRILAFHTAETLPLFDEFAHRFCVLDRWFATFPGATYPNRMCMLAGMTRETTNAGLIPDLGYLDEPTLFDELDRMGIDWRLYESDFTFLRAFDRHRLDFHRIRPIREFLDGGTAPLPPVTFVEPNFTGAPSASGPNDDHPPTNVAHGQAFLREVYQRVVQSESWSRTLLIITYDEHGGFYDHVPPPGTERFHERHPEVSRDLPRVHPRATMLCPRVPTFAISPRIRAGTVGHRIYDHTSIIRTVLQRFAPDRLPYMPEAVRRARHLGELIQRDLLQPTVVLPPAIDPPAEPPVRTSWPESDVHFERIARDPEDPRTLLRELALPRRARPVR